LRVGNQVNRRQHERFAVPPMYTPISVRLLDETVFTLEGHAYDISEAGVQFELDHPIAPGTPIAIQIMLPPNADELGPGRSVYAIANVIRLVEDPDEPGPVRMACAFTSFARLGDRERLIRHLVRGRYARAA
jgi:hypothetical protein